MNRKSKLALVAAVLFLAPAAALAANTGPEFQNLYEWINDVVTGYFGLAVSVAAVGIGALLSIARVNPIPILGGLGFAIFLNYTPTIISGILGATI